MEAGPGDGAKKPGVNYTVIGGLALIAIAAVILISSIGGGDNDPDNDGRERACKLGAPGLAAVATGLSAGRDAGAIVAVVGGPLANEFCRGFVESLVETPTEPVEFELETETGVESEVVSKQELVAPPPQPPPTTTRPILPCFGYTGEYLVRLCIDGVIGPPVQAQAPAAPPYTP